MAYEKVCILAVKTVNKTDEQFESTVEEMESLSVTAGGEVVATITQNRPKIHPVTYVGEGKLTEVKQTIEAEDISVVVVNDELSPSQLRNMNDVLNVKIIDRSQLILDIFAQRATTKEAQLQVELAQLQYMLPRLRGMGLVLSRLGAGIGTRGPGETKLETDQRHIRRRIDDIKKRLKDVVRQREQYRKRRKQNHVFQIAIVGYTNAGKSTLFNKLTEEKTLEENLLFATLEPLTRQIQLPSGFSCLVTDTVGFLQDLPTTLIEAFKSTLEEAAEADLLLHVVDATNENYVKHEETVENILEQLEAHKVPMLTLYNKKDLLEDTFIPREHPNLLISAYDETDLKKVQVKIEHILMEAWEKYDIRLQPENAHYLYQLEEQSIIINSEFNEESNEYEVEGFIAKDHPLQSVLKEK
ncbi:MAG TPA: GTPase HflX [Pseudogracilibacillus sp.]|nr:GTPase HflX [Pseudogracilibacillus sp.]